MQIFLSKIISYIYCHSPLLEFNKWSIMLCTLFMTLSPVPSPASGILYDLKNIYWAERRWQIREGKQVSTVSQQQTYEEGRLLLSKVTKELHSILNFKKKFIELQKVGNLNIRDFTLEMCQLWLPTAIAAEWTGELRKKETCGRWMKKLKIKKNWLGKMGFTEEGWFWWLQSW